MHCPGDAAENVATLRITIRTDFDTADVVEEMGTGTVPCRSTTSWSMKTTKSWPPAYMLAEDIRKPPPDRSWWPACWRWRMTARCAFALLKRLALRLLLIAAVFWGGGWRLAYPSFSAVMLERRRLAVRRFPLSRINWVAIDHLPHGWGWR